MIVANSSDDDYERDNNDPFFCCGGGRYVDDNGGGGDEPWFDDDSGLDLTCREAYEFLYGECGYVLVGANDVPLLKDDVIAWCEGGEGVYANELYDCINAYYDECALVVACIEQLLPEAELRLLYDVSHNTCKVERHRTRQGVRELYIHRKGATRAFGPGHPDLPAGYREVGQPVLIGGSMGTASYILCGTSEGEEKSFSSACHGAGRAMSRRAAGKRWRGHQVVDDLARRGILIRSPSTRGVAEEAPGAYKDVSAVVDASDRAGLARKVAQLKPVVCIKG